MFAVSVDQVTLTRGKDWFACPTCRRRIFRWTEDGIEVAPGAKVWHPVPRIDGVARMQCSRGHWSGPDSGWPFNL
jgi:hypothetical protein